MDKITREKCSELLENGTVRMLILLLHSHNIQLPGDLSREEMIEEYMRKANLKQNISKALSDIIKKDHENKQKMNAVKLVIDTSNRTESESADSNYLSIIQILEELRNKIHQQYTRAYKVLPSQTAIADPETSCNAFSRFCNEHLKMIDIDAIKENDHYQDIFEQLGGFYVLIDLLQTHSIFGNNDCQNDDCEALHTSIILFISVCFSNPKSDTDFISSLCHQLARSPFHIKVFVNLLRRCYYNYDLLHQTLVSIILGLLIAVFMNVKTIEFDILENCEAMTCFTDIMLSVKKQDYDHDQKIHEENVQLTLELIYFILTNSERACREFYRIDGAVAFVISKYVRNYSWVIDGDFSRKDENNTVSSWKNGRIPLHFLYTITENLYSAYPEVQNLYWDADLSRFLVEVIKLIQPDYKFIDDDESWDFHINSSIEVSLMALDHILEASQRERDKTRQLVDDQFFSNISNFPSLPEPLLKTVGSILEHLES